jgi:apolipoprotein D and lipocalin family protein
MSAWALGRRRTAVRLLSAVLATATAMPAESAPLQSLAALDLAAYAGTWYQVALYPNAFQRQCVSDTTATYTPLASGAVEVVNRCRLADGSIDAVTGEARPTGQVDGEVIRPAQLEVSFLPRWLRWLPFGWGAYWVVRLAEDGRYAVVSEPSREYLWVLSRTPSIPSGDESAIRSWLEAQGFDPARLQRHPHKAPLR